jgi:hypothetical protein
MNPPDIDRSRLAEYKQIMAEVQAKAEVELKKATQSMSAGERTKLNRLLKNIEVLGDVGKAAGKSRVKRELLDKWMNTSGVCWHINKTLNDARFHAHRGEVAEDILFRNKIAPELEKDLERFGMTGYRHRESRVIAKLAARDLKAYRWEIVQAANNGDKNFFIDLAKCLTGDIATDFYDKLDRDIAEIWCNDRTITAPAAVAELKRRGHSVNGELFRMRKQRLGLARPKSCKV